MSKIGNHRVELQESDSYKLDQVIAELGLQVAPHMLKPGFDVELVQLGWDDYHAQERQS